MTLTPSTTPPTSPATIFRPYKNTNTTVTDRDSTTTTTTVTVTSQPHKPTEDDHFLALSLMLLAGDNSTTQLSPSPTPHHHSDHFRYTCNICNKEFSTYQALGGHKSSHRRNVPPTFDDQPSTSGAVIGINKGHECSICHRSFLTGQALGGHKRRHYDGGNIASSSFHGQPRDFDLNLPACPECPLGLGVDG